MIDSQRVTMADVARVSGASLSTVSKVINGRDGVAASTVARVQGVIDELGYETSLVARSLRSRRTNVLGILVAEFEPFSAEVLKGVSTAVGATGYELMAYSAGGRAESQAGWERRSLARLSGTLIDGAILVTPSVVGTSTSIPVVSVDPHTGPAGMPTVDSDGLAGAISATRHLLDLGHRRIGHLSGRPDLESSRLREKGYRQAMADAGVGLDPNLIQVGDYRREVALVGARTLLTLPEPPTAIFAANDISAIATIEVAGELGLKVPADLSVVGYDNVPESALCDPPLTTVSQPMQQMGAEALDLLVHLLDGSGDRSTHVHLPTRLIERASCAPPR